MPDYQQIYATQSELYEQLVSYEDYQGNLGRALRQIRPFDGLDVIELGAGTARVTRLLAPVARSMCAFDLSWSMLRTGRAQLAQAGPQNWGLAVSDNRRLAARDGIADVSVAGWSLGHLSAWFPQTWPDEIGQALAQMQRVLRPGGTVIIIETLGTGHTSPRPPHENLAAYYRWLEREHRFASTWIRTDYHFPSLDQATKLTRFFFGDDLADRVLAENLLILPECTGLWWLNTEE
jgi:ubiquinone/menaquinone biosynthesis C-methylase UbiE